ncbi:MAG: tRNA glutamyl-Q synthetase [Bacteroidetes bacterium]|nr:tRNA glutamyl-Q synthetase [Bacteroidota bacterium]
MEESKRQFSKTRVAPTPSGFLHLGNVLSFAITAAVAEQTGAKILLRIDDLDRDRVRKEYVQDIFDTLNFLEIPWHEGPRNFADYDSEFSQGHRLPLNHKALDELKQSRQLFACTCSRAQAGEIYPGTCRDKNIPFDAKDVSWRLKTNASAEINVNTLNNGIIKTHLPTAMQDFVVRKKDGYPAYQLASVIDDVHFGIDLVVRGVDLWDSTLAQLYLASALQLDDFQRTTFHHHGLLAENNGKKLSKSAGDTSVRYLRGQGKKREDIYTAIAAMAGHEEVVKDRGELAALFIKLNPQASRAGISKNDADHFLG